MSEWMSVQFFWMDAVLQSESPAYLMYVGKKTSLMQCSNEYWFTWTCVVDSIQSGNETRFFVFLFFLYVFILDDWNKDFLFICCLFLVLQNWRRVICVHPFSEWSNKMKWITKCDWWACTIGNMRKIQNFKSWCNCHFSSGNNMKLEREKCNRKNGRQFSGPKMWME